MSNERLSSRLNDLLETLAAIEHERWAHWQRYLHSKCEPIGGDGALLITGNLVRRWEEQIGTSYSNLTEDQKESDREQVRKYLPLIVQAICDCTSD